MVKTIDVGRSRGGLFFEVASIGMGAALLGEAHEIATGRLGSIRELIRAFVFTPAARMSIEIDDRTIQTDALMVAVAMHRLPEPAWRLRRMPRHPCRRKRLSLSLIHI